MLCAHNTPTSICDTLEQAPMTQPARPNARRHITHTHTHIAHSLAQIINSFFIFIYLLSHLMCSSRVGWRSQQTSTRHGTAHSTLPAGPLLHSQSPDSYIYLNKYLKAIGIDCVAMIFGVWIHFPYCSRRGHVGIVLRFINRYSRCTAHRCFPRNLWTPNQLGKYWLSATNEGRPAATVWMQRHTRRTQSHDRMPSSVAHRIE